MVKIRSLFRISGVFIVVLAILLIYSCKKDNFTVPGPPTIGTAIAGNGQATVTFTPPVSNGGLSIISYIVTSSPGGLTGTGPRPITVSGLTNGTAYTFTVTATNAIGTSVASSPSNPVTPVIPTPVSDIEGNVYNTVTIGTQVWMAENLKTTRYNDGTIIPNITKNSEWEALTTPAYCWYRNDSSTYNATYGAMYNWYTVDVSSNGGKNVCPTGWHIPTDAEWTTLTTYLGGEGVAGNRLKEMGSTHWRPTNWYSTNESGFTALPGGLRTSYGTFMYVGNIGGWWCSDAYWWEIVYSVGRRSGGEKGGFSLRCLRDF